MVPRVYEDIEACDTRLDPAIGFGGMAASNTSQSAVVIRTTGASVGGLQGPAARFVAVNTPRRIRIMVVSPVVGRLHGAPTRVDWAVAVAAGLMAAGACLGVVAALT